jgi:hypothetical protein
MQLLEAEPTLTPAESVARLNRLAASPAVDDLLAADRVKTDAARKLAADAIAAIDEKLATDTAAARAAYKKADGVYLKALQAYQAAELARREAYMATQHASNSAAVAKSKHEAFLQDSADPAIHALYAEISRQHGRHPSGEEINRAGGYEKFELIRAQQLAALRELDTLWREPLTATELKARLARIRTKALDY